MLLGKKDRWDLKLGNTKLKIGGQDRQDRQDRQSGWKSIDAPCLPLGQGL